MTPENAVRRHLLDRLRRLDEDDAEHLAEELDASFLKQRVRKFHWWMTGVRKWMLFGYFAVMFLMALAPVASDLGASFTLIGFGSIIAVMGSLFSWQRKKVIYEILAVMADPEYEPEHVPF